MMCFGRLVFAALKPLNDELLVTRYFSPGHPHVGLLHRLCWCRGRA